MNRTLRALVAGAGLATILATSGCMLAVLCVGGAGLAVGATVYQEGILRTLEANPMPQVWESTLRTINELDFRLLETVEEPEEHRLEARGPDDEKIRIWMSPWPDDPDVTDLRIQIGIVGDEELSRHILRTIRSRL